MAKRITEDDMREFVESVGFTYIKSYRKGERNTLYVTVVCKNGHENDVIYSNFKNKNGVCKDCAKEKLSELKRKPIEIVINEFNKRGFTVIEGIDTYKNNTSEFLLRCENGHEVRTNYSKFVNTVDVCPECSGRNYLTIEYIRCAFAERNYTLLEDEFIDAKTKMKYICNEHPNKVRYIHWNNFKNGRGCLDCSKDKNKLKTKERYYEIEKEFCDRGYTLLTTYDEYENTHQYLKYICDKHPHLEVQSVTYNNFRVTNHNCESCKSENVRRGEDCHNWKGGIEPLYDHLRRKLGNWKQESMKQCEYRCVITGGYFDVIHHLYSFNKIVDETLNVLELDVRKNMGDYKTEELKNIEIVCLELHEKYGYGVCLCNEAHDLFHKLYGKYDNTHEQFNEFKLMYENGELNIENTEAVV